MSNSFEVDREEAPKPFTQALTGGSDFTRRFACCCFSCRAIINQPVGYDHLVSNARINQMSRT